MLQQAWPEHKTQEVIDNLKKHHSASGSEKPKSTVTGKGLAPISKYQKSYFCKQIWPCFSIGRVAGTLDVTPTRVYSASKRDSRIPLAKSKQSQIVASHFVESTNARHVVAKYQQPMTNHGRRARSMT